MEDGEAIDQYFRLTFTAPQMKKVEFANRVDLDEVAYNEPPHLNLHCLSSGLRNLNRI